MDEHKNSEEVEGRKILKPWADKHGIVKHSDLVDQLLEASTNSRNLPEEEKRWITHSMHFDCGMPFYKSDKFVGGASITPYQKIKQYLLEVQGRQQLVETNEHQIDILEIEIEEKENRYSKEEPDSYAARLLRIEISEHERKLRQFR